MKKILILFFSLNSLLACKDTADMDLGPNIRFDSEPDQEYFVKNDSILFFLTLSALEGINTLEVDHVSRNFPILRLGETTFQNSTSQFISFYYVIDSLENTGDTALISFRIIDNKGQSKETSYQYKVAAEIDTATLIFGDQLNPGFGNCLSIQDLKIYNITEAQSISEKIDFLLYNDSILSWVLLSPNADSGNDTLIPELVNFNTKKNTVFDRGIYTASFDGLNNDGPLVAIDSIPQTKYIDSISGSTVIYFLTEEEKRGVLRLSNFTDTLGNFGTLELKVQR